MAPRSLTVATTFGPAARAGAATSISRAASGRPSTALGFAFMIRRLLTTLVLCTVTAVVGAGAMFWWAKLRRPKLPDPPALVLQMREVARLETLDVTLYKKVSFEPDPEPSATVIGDVLTWAKFTLRP